MPSDRDHAQQLAEIITPACAGADCWPRAVREITAAILDTPGVEVDIEYPVTWPRARRLVIRLPAQPIGETP